MANIYKIKNLKLKNSADKYSPELKQINDCFNKELQRQIAGTLSKNHTYQIGNAGCILQSAGIPDMPIELQASRLKNKSIQTEHPFDLCEMRDLPNSIQNPLAVFDSSTVKGSFVILTELEHKNKNFIAALETTLKQNRIKINSIRSIYPRKTKQVLSAINNDLSKYFHKKRMLEWASKQRFNSAEVRHSFEHSSTKLQKEIEIAIGKIKDFENLNNIK